MKKSYFIIIIIVLVILIGGGIFYFFSKNKTTTDNGTVADPFAFNPLNRGTVSNTTRTKPVATSTDNNQNTNNNTSIKMPALRQLSITPVAGMFASSTKTKSAVLGSTTIETTIVRFIDRGAGHIFQADDLHLGIDEISNTTLPKIYESYWNKNLNAVVLRYLKDDSDIINNFYAEIRPTATSTASTTTKFEIKGKYLSPDIREIAVSPLGDKIFTWNIENGNGFGYLSGFDEKNKTKIIDSPLTQVNIDWPEASTVTFTTKGNSGTAGYSYTANAKTGEINKLLGGINGLSVKLSKDAKKVLYSSGGNKITTTIANLKNNTTSPVIFSTLADKCVWSSLRKTELYCAVPTEIPNTASYPEDWYKGTVSFVDQIWHVDTETGEVHLLANLLTLSKQLMDAEQLTLDPKENFLYFINKRDLSLWSLDLNQ